ncbi:MAG: tRNA 2-thiouridine(34) synthase MnmA [Bacillota bacterium]|nr:tRNA 2-thiouridine(34) synthase MnmA [Bacillota bacterium]
MNKVEYKKTLRRSLIQERRNMEEEARMRYSSLVAREVHAKYRQKLVCSYIAFRGEVDLKSLHELILSQDRILLLPYVDGDRMLFCEVKDLENLVVSRMGIPEPDPKRSKIWSYEEIWAADPLVLTPGVAFTRDGGRMGYGGGFYDRFFAVSRGRGTKVGICYRMQLQETLPLEDHDIKVDDVVYAPKKVVLGLSGGVDSAVAAHLLKEQGYEVAGAHLRMWKPRDVADLCDSDADVFQYRLLEADADMSALREEYRNAPDVLDAALVAARLEIPLYSCDLRKKFKDEVVDYFVQEYLRGRTPNPCTHCNRVMKFKSLIEMADAIGAEYVATGHYAKIWRNAETGRFEIVSPADSKKDQGYMLSRLSQEQLSRFLTPLSDVKDKAEVRKIAASLGLHVSEKKDSQEICFVEDTYLEVLSELGAKGKSGHFVLDGEAVRQHNGIEQYTVGQRKGLGAFGKPVFVVEIDEITGDVLLGDHEDLFTCDVYFSEINYVSLPEGLEPGRCTAKIRYAAGKEDCVVSAADGGCERFVAHFDEPQRAPTPGQIIVLYDGNRILASGVIEKNGQKMG